tara:strand:- start:64 stop:252 length:189 start_codon:yes stop_codon:yes gene_type:complete
MLIEVALFVGLMEQCARVGSELLRTAIAVVLMCRSYSVVACVGLGLQVWETGNWLVKKITFF